MPNLNPQGNPIYQIRVKGHLDPQWTDWFEGMNIAPERNGETRITGPVADQALLHGLLRKVRDLGLPLIAVQQVDEPMIKGDSLAALDKRLNDEPSA